MIEFRPLAIPDVVEISPLKLEDHRGYFSEVYSDDAFEAAGIRIRWIQDNQSFSRQVGTIRGLHFQTPAIAQDKLVRVLRGTIYDVAVDIRKGSPHYGKWVGCELSPGKWNQLLVPAGFAHGFMTLEPDTEVLYKVSAPYSRENEGAILWNDPMLAIDWPDLGTPLTLSHKDRVAASFADFESPFAYEG